jgi:hypothetical protein
LWLLKEVWYGTFPYTNVKLHRKYGKLGCSLKKDIVSTTSLTAINRARCSHSSQ